MSVVVKRVLWFDEPASSFFSILDGVIAFNLWISYVDQVKPFSPKGKTFPYHKMWLAYSIVWTITYLVSTIFHTQTATYNSFFLQCLDYFMPTIALLFSLIAGLIRLFNIENRKTIYLMVLIASAWCVKYFHYMIFVLFDFGLHIKNAVTLIGLSQLTWIAFCIKNRDRPYTKYYWFTLITLLISAPLEIWDFPNRMAIWGHFDSHSIWHLMGAPIEILFMKFVIEDSMYECNKRHNSGKFA